MNVNSIITKEGVLNGTVHTDGKTTGTKTKTADKTFDSGVTFESGKKAVNPGTYTAQTEKEEQTNTFLEENETTDTREALNQMAGTMTEQDCEELGEEGMTLESYEAGRLNRALARMKENREFTEENIENRIDGQEELEEEITKIAIKNKISDTTAKKLAQKLVESDLPVTENSIMAMVQALQMGESVSSLSDDGMAYLLENGQEATIENIHSATYAGKTSTPVTDEVWEAIKEQIEGVIEEGFGEVTEESLLEGRWLLDHEVPVTPDTLEELSNLKGIRTEADEDYLLNRMTEAIRQGKAPKEANLDLDTVRTRRQLEEIRLSMSETASKALEEKGIVIDTENMKEVIKELREIEDSYYKSLLSEAGMEASEDTTSLLKETLVTAAKVAAGPAYVLGRTLETRNIETLESLSVTSEAMREQAAARLEEAYEPLWTAPRSDYGDSIQKAFQNTSELLSELGLEATEANQRAVRILGYNRMEITESSIHEVKAYDAKVSEVLSGLKPAVTVELIRRGENPLNLTMDELKNSLDSIQEEIGAGAEEKYSTYLWKLEKLSGGLTEEERSSYIGIYRLLNNIEKTDGAAIGAVLNTGAELTLSNLLSAVRTLKNKGIDKKVDDSFGGLTDLTFSTERISDQIERAFNQGSALAEARLNARTERSERTERGVQTEYLGSLVNRTLDNLSPEQVIKTVEESEGDVMAFSLESFCERLQEQKEDATLSKSYYKEQLKEVQRLAEDKEAVAFLETYGGEATIRNLQAADTWFTGNKNLYKEIGKKADNISKETGDGYKESIKEVLEGMDSQESLLESQKKVNASMEGIIKEAFSEPALTANEAENLRLMQKGIALARTLSRQEHYEMPVVIGDEVSSLSLTILKGTQTSGKAEIRIDFPKQGVVEAELTVKNDEIKGFILCKTKDGQELVEDCLDGLKEGLEGLGLTVKQMNVGTSNKGMATGSKATKSENDQTDTKVLYQAAKLLVKQTIERAQVIENGS